MNNLSVLNQIMQQTQLLHELDMQLIQMENQSCDIQNSNMLQNNKMLLSEMYVKAGKCSELLERINNITFPVNIPPVAYIPQDVSDVSDANVDIPQDVSDVVSDVNVDIPQDVSDVNVDIPQDVPTNIPVQLHNYPTISKYTSIKDPKILRMRSYNISGAEETEYISKVFNMK